MGQEINQIAVIGAGIMGHGIAQVCAQAGKKVTLVDSSDDAIRTAPARINENVATMQQNGFLSLEQVAGIMTNIEFTTRLPDAVSKADIIFEAIPEKYDLKKPLYKQLGQICRREAIFASNTSGIPITKIANIIKTPDRVIGTHFYMPAHLVPLVEVIQMEHTSDDVIEATMNLLKDLGKCPVRVRKDIPGFIGNRLQHALAREAMSLVEKGVATPEDIDTVVKTSLGVRLLFTRPVGTKRF